MDLAMVDRSPTDQASPTDRSPTDQASPTRPGAPAGPGEGAGIVHTEHDPSQTGVSLIFAPTFPAATSGMPRYMRDEPSPGLVPVATLTGEDPSRVLSLTCLRGL